MATLVWDDVGERRYSSGIDRGVLYVFGIGVPWNGLTSVEEQFDVQNTPYYLDGVKYLNRLTPGDFSAKLKAFTYPEEFERLNGIESPTSGVFIHDQMMQTFGMSYRNRLGNDVSGVDLGYRIHILYNLSAVPDATTYATMADVTKPIEFGWTLFGRPENVPGYKPTAHVSFDSTALEPERLDVLENVLYGTENTNPGLPSLSELIGIVSDPIVITDNGDGTWTATGPDIFFEIVDTTFQIMGANATYLNDTTYNISST